MNESVEANSRHPLRTRPHPATYNVRYLVMSIRSEDWQRRSAFGLMMIRIRHLIW